jgi:2-polyprenyl-3-methyl-5-hydroxy-6-metoxy-1,4-benzoquinol methylase
MNFNDRAREWDTEERVERMQMIAGEVETALSGKTYKRALEFGCGTGLVSFNLRHLFSEITLVDSSEEMIRVTQNKIDSTSASNMRAYNLDIVEGDTLPGQYDLIYMSLVLHHVIDTRGLLMTLSKHLDQGGCLCIVDLNEDNGNFHKADKEYSGHNGFDTDKLAKLLTEIGCETPSSKVIYSGFRDRENAAAPYSFFLLTAKKK